MNVSLIVVNFRSAELTESAIESGRRATARELEVVIVDNSGDEVESSRLRKLEPDHLIVADSNLGYAGGINRGLDSCTGDIIVASNPDVIFSDGSIDLLVEPLGEPGVMLTGPCFFWDQELTWHLPPPETMGFREQMMRNLALRFEFMERGFTDRRLARRIGFWRLQDDVDVDVLSGAVMTFRSDDLRRFRFDEGYPLYFEEVDLMRRIRRAGGTLRYVPRARVQHMWAQSSARNPDTKSLFERSRRRFQKKWYGSIGDMMLTGTSGRGPSRCAAPLLNGTALSLPEHADLLVELGDGREFLMATGRFVRGGTVELPDEMLRLSPLEELCCRVVDLADRSVIQSWTVR